ncbi:thioredoxin domain-containing protein [Alphaproteobacteria bacterium GH1-50]|uniref:Thioredoxin domain-containing protein n=1 Tax=Kangsaoukella pontilimi TaxID=2691042 RepID=A0A7C9IHZ5_9RHOB|nr:DsbA family protein [Kangsaoukella pontilimi]MXQ09428.1 thioredoxin domain-containing protein [Kangsaoukella pontilimi]
MTRPMTALAAFVLTVFAALALVASPAQAQDADVDTSGIVEMTMGDPDAPVTVIEYASYTCPHCARFHADTFKQLKADYIDTGKVHFIYREVYFDRFGLWASIVARCGEGAENRFFGITDMLYAQQGDWARQDDPAQIVERLRRIGKTAGLTDGQLDQCLTDADNAQALYARWLELGEEDGIDSTPSFVIDGRKYANMPYAEMSELIDNAVGG